MPDLKRFLDGFDVYEGLTLANYELTDIQGEEKTIQRYREYEYRILLTFEYIGDHRPNPILLRLRLNELARNKVIETAYHNPYQCRIADIKIYNILEDNHIVNISVLGHCHRI